MTSDSWANSFPPNQGLYDSNNEKDSCGVGFIVQIKGIPSHSIISDAKTVLENMDHRGAKGANPKDGDGAGVMISIPKHFFQQFIPNDIKPFSVGNVFLHQDKNIRDETKMFFETLADSLGLKVLRWRRVPVDNSILGPIALLKEPVVEQPFIILKDDSLDFNLQLFRLKKIATKKIPASKWFYICSLNFSTIVYKGLLSPKQVYHYYTDLRCEEFVSHFALVHSRFSTNTFPSWDRAQPMRLIAHNGEINTLRGNKNWIHAREGTMKSDRIENLQDIFPTVEIGGSDSSAFDNVLELLVANGKLSLPEAVMLMIPEAWQQNEQMDSKKKAFYKWASCVMEPWDGPALLAFTDGKYIGACLDRNGLRPCRYYITSDDIMVCASEVGTLFIDPIKIIAKGRLMPGKILLVDTVKGVIVEDEDFKSAVSNSRPYDEWTKNIIHLSDLKKSTLCYNEDYDIFRDPRMQLFDFSVEELNMILLPLICEGKESLGSMGTDTPLACISKNPQSIFNYFRQIFAQVTNPPIDPIREKIVMGLESYLGPENNMLDCNEQQCRRISLNSPILTLDEMETIRNSTPFKVTTLSITVDAGRVDYINNLDSICFKAEEAINNGSDIIVLSDKDVSSSRVPLSSLIVQGAVHHFLIKKKLRTKVGLIAETAEARQVHHMCVLLGYGADAICPYFALECIYRLHKNGTLANLTFERLVHNYITGLSDGILKVMSKMGISVLQSYKGAQIFEALGVDNNVVDKCFKGTPSRIKGSDFSKFSDDAVSRHLKAYRYDYSVSEGGEYHWRMGGEHHINDPQLISDIQDAVRNKNQESYDRYSRHAYENIKNCTLRGLLDFSYTREPIPIEEVEPWTEIVKRFCTGAMSFGSISLEAHSTLAIAMNRLGGKSNTGEGGEDPSRSVPMKNGDSKRSAIKQVASGRFGVTSFYLSDADELQIKMAQGAKPGEGGELPGHKVSAEIAYTRKSTKGVGLISPPPHHDIYSIEDLKQLIYDLKTSNPNARISVKLVAEVGVGVIAVGVAKAKADHILISGHDGGTGASRWTGIKHAGIPWEIGLAEAHQTLVLNGLRGRIVLQTDGQIKTGRDVAVSCLLGAEEWGFATTPLIALGCIMMRKCHLNTCPVGIATQDKDLRKKFEGQPEHVINFFYYVAEETRKIMASLGFRTIKERFKR
jgi:glutamate synthase (NADPH/NADH)